MTFAHFNDLIAIDGKVTNINGEAISNVYVVNLRNDAHAHSDLAGYFNLEDAKEADTLRFVHITYEENFVILQQNQKSLNVVLYEKSFSLEEVTIRPRENSLSLLSEIDLVLDPVNSAQEILRKVPGLFIGQHAGGGKAEQIFLRGFDIDHGTDIQIEVDGMPVNMVSHAHGQGYADLHFLIPETVERIDFHKGPYMAEHGNFNTAGYVGFKSKEYFERNILKVEGGAFNTSRLFGAFNLINKDKTKGYIASEILRSDGPFDSPQNFKRINIMGSLNSALSEKHRLRFSLSHFRSNWDASGQIPIRAIESGQIGWFGAIDDTEGGFTSRTNANLHLICDINENTLLTNQIYFSHYDFELYSNFTFFLNDTANGDQIRQKEDRVLFGIKSELAQSKRMNEVDLDWKIGLQLREDIVNNNELSRTRNRSETLNRIRFGDVQEHNLSAYSSARLSHKKWSVQGGLRYEIFDFEYLDDLDSIYSKASEVATGFFPKVNLTFDQSNSLQFYFSAGTGFHSNDSRLVTSNAVEDFIPSGPSYDLGLNWKPFENTFVNIALWQLDLDQEFVYVGDEGIVEPSGRTSRRGIDFSWRQQFSKRLSFNTDINYAHARSIDEPENEDFIPLAPNFTLASGLYLKMKEGLESFVKVRHMGDRAANEDNSIIAEGYSIFDVGSTFSWQNIALSVSIQNILNTEWKETQFATLSRLQGESNPVEEIHFTPGTPRFLMVKLAYHFD
ncbi:MAG: TonB-dependent receptor [Bacteroidota bacterium]